MICEEQFQILHDRAMKLEYSSFGPLGYEDCMNAEVHMDTEDTILLIDRSRNPNHIHWASSDPLCVIRLMEDMQEAIRIDFVPKEYLHSFQDAGFSIWAEYVDFFNDELGKTESPFIDYDSIRFLESPDVPMIEAVSKSCAGYASGFTGETREWFQDWMKENDIMIIKENDLIVGYCCISIYANGTILWIREIAVIPSHRRKGFGKRLLEQALFFGVRQGAKRAFLHADVQNANAIRLYEKYGFSAKSIDGELQMTRSSR